MAGAGCSDDPPPTACEMPQVDPPTSGITLEKLLEETADVSGLARLPDPPWTAHMTSSFDPRSKTGTWFANNDAGNYQGKTGDEFVMLEADGPGVITRIWSANPHGTLRVYIDGAATPALDEDMAALLRGQIVPFGPPWGFVAGLGSNFYFPIPYAKSVRVTTTGPKNYYHVQYRTYAKGTVVESFTRKRAPRAVCALSKVAGILDDGASTAGLTFTASSEDVSDKPVVVDAPAGGGVVEALVVRTQAGRDGLRGAILRVAFDGETTITAPLGDFFGSGPGRTTMTSLLTRVDDDAFVSRWPMPFAKQARFSVEHVAGGTSPVAIEIAVKPRPFDDKSLYLYAHWRAPKTMRVVDKSNVQTPLDWNIAAIEGQGRYVGTVVNVTDPTKPWWGEGDEKIFIDGEKFPSHFGTGTEDFFGYAWCSTERFSNAWIGQTRARAADNAGRISNYRWQLADSMPFSKSLKFDMEVLHWQGVAPTDVTMDAVVLYYARPGAEESGPVPKKTEYVVPKLPAALEETGKGSYTCG